MPKHTFPRIAYRYVSGRPLDGEPRTDGSYLHRGTRILTKTGRTSRWSMLPGWQRQLVRLGVPATVAGVTYAHQVEPQYTTGAFAALAGLGGVHGLRRAHQGVKMYRFNSTYVRPTVKTLQAGLGCGVHLDVDPALGTLVERLAKPLSPAEEAVRAWYGERIEPAVRYLPDRAQRALWAIQARLEPAVKPFRRPVEETGPCIRLSVDATYLSADDRKLVSSVIGSKIPVRDTVETIDQVGDKVTMVWKVRKQPPARVELADIEPYLDTIAEDEFILGLAADGKPFTVSLADDAPHIAISAGSGAGKSVLAQLLAAQVLRRGGKVVIIDIKGSHKWAKNLPGVKYCITGEQAHDALVDLAELADQRNTDAFDSDDDDFDPGPRHLVIMEEVNAGVSILNNYWQGVRVKGDPVTSPAVVGLRFLLFTGRSAKINVVAIAQSLTARAIGGPEARENFAIRCLARYSVNAWKMLCPQAAMPRSSRVRGRWAIVIGDTATGVQVAYLTPAQVRRVARVTESAKIPEARLSRDVAGDGNMIDPLSEPLTLREAIDGGILPWTYEAAKMRLSRARKAGSGKAPSPVGKSGRADLFRRGDLIVWVESERVS